MQEEQNQNPKRDFTGSDNKLSSESTKGEETPTDQTESDNKKKDTTDIKQEPYNIIINVPEKKDKAAKTGNIISVMNVLVAAALAIFTYLLFYQATKDSTTSEKSAAAALWEQKKEFQSENAALIVIDSIKWFNTISKVGFSFRMGNIGKTPAFKVRFGNITYLSVPKDTIFHYTENLNRVTNRMSPIVISPGGHIYNGNDSLTFMNNDVMSSLFKKENSIYLAVEITYQDNFGENHYTHLFAEVIVENLSGNTGYWVIPIGSYNSFK